LLERARMPRAKVCGEYLSPATLAALDAIGLLQDLKPRAHTLTWLCLAGFGIGPLRMRLPGFGGLAIARTDLDFALAQAAQAAGTQMCTGTFVRADEGTDFIDVVYRDEMGEERTLRARALVGADGSWSSVAARMGMADGRRHGGRWAVGGHLAAARDSDEVEMFVGAHGYYARNPLGNGLINVMLVMPRALLDDEADRCARELSGGRYGMQQSELVRRVAVGPLRYRAHTATYGRTLLTGDAAELLDPFLGQGIAMAVGLAGPAAEAALALASAQSPQAATREYARARRHAAGRIRLAARVVDTLLRVPWLRGRAARKLASRPELADQLLAVVAGADADERRLALAWDLIA
jgi:2-polyprenyl-6-methoxyphenol hydroxylase-like FAD-dependent oxidoreductase